MILTLAKVVALHVEFPIIEIGEPSLQLSFSVAGLRANGLSLKDRVHADLCHRLKVFCGVLGGSRGRDWSIRRSCITWCGGSFFGARGLLWLAGAN